MKDGFGSLDATAQAELVRRGEVKPLELVDAAIDRIERINPQLNAVIIPLFEKARAQATSPDLADGPFRGVPFLLKDLDTFSAGDPFYAGTRFLRDLGWVADHDSFFTQKLRAAGFIFVGKTNTPEFGLMPTTEPLSYGPSHNPWDTSRSTGGSSGGSAAAVASGMVAAAHAADGGGSIRIPASACGLVGLKPSRGRVSLGPEYGEYWHGFVINHAVTRSVRDSARILDVIAGPMPGDPYTAPPPARPFQAEVNASPGKLRVGFTTGIPGGDRLAPDCATAVTETARLLERLGHIVEDSSPTALGERAAITQHFVAIFASWLASSIDEWSETTGKTIGPDGLEPTTWALAEVGRSVSAARYVGSIKWVHAFTRRVASWWTSGFDLLVTPTLGEVPARLGDLVAPLDNPLAIERAAAYTPFTPLFNMTGQPAISLPLFWSDEGLPVGVQLVAAYGREDVLLRIAAQLEKARPWADRWPPVRA